MRNVRYILVLLLVVNCTAELDDDLQNRNIDNQQPETQTCVNDLPEVKLTNNSLQNFEYIIYGHDYSVLHTQTILANTDSGWISLPANDAVAVVTNNVVYGQKMQLSPELCDDIELEIDTTNKLLLIAE